nr:GNAT family N-acetyltransferase [Roseococcus pinisoli]
MPGAARKHFAALVRDEARNTLGGAIGSSYYGWLVIDLLWLPETLRGTGLGTQVMRLSEAEARARGCAGIRLDTYSFQARGFYEKLGFSLFGTLPDHPPGHTRYWLAKRLD